MKKLAILVVAGALSIGAVACSKKKADTTPATGDTAVPTGDTGGATYGGDAYGMPAGENPCGGAANPCGGE